MSKIGPLIEIAVILNYRDFNFFIKVNDQIVGLLRIKTWDSSLNCI